MKWIGKVTLLIIGIWTYIIGTSILLDSIFDSNLFSTDYSNVIIALILTIMLFIFIIFKINKIMKTTDENIQKTYNITRKKYYVLAILLWILINTLFTLALFIPSFATFLKLDKWIGWDGIIMILLSIITIIVGPLLSIIIIKIKDKLTKK